VAQISPVWQDASPVQADWQKLGPMQFLTGTQTIAPPSGVEKDEQSASEVQVQSGLEWTQNMGQQSEQALPSGAVPSGA
jgi:hypothetical protein